MAGSFKQGNGARFSRSNLQPNVQTPDFVLPKGWYEVSVSFADPNNPGVVTVHDDTNNIDLLTIRWGGLTGPFAGAGYTLQLNGLVSLYILATNGLRNINFVQVAP